MSYSPLFELVGPAVSAGPGRPAYWGVDRHFARSGVAWESDPASAVWKEYCTSEWDDAGTDLLFSKRVDAIYFQQALAAHGHRFDVIVVRRCETAEEAERASQELGFSGFDIASNELHSSLSPRALWRDIDGGDDPMLALWSLTQCFARQVVGGNGLVSGCREALLLSSAMRALERVDATQQTLQGVAVYAVFL